MDERIHDITGTSALPVGSIIWMMRTLGPAGFFLCNGQTIILQIENGLFVYTDSNGNKHDCTDFNTYVVPNLSVAVSESTYTITLPDLRGRTCVGPKKYSSGFDLQIGNSFTGMVPGFSSQQDDYTYLPSDKNTTTVRTKYKNVFSGAWGYWGDGFGRGAFKTIHSYEKSSGASSHGGSGVTAIALDLQSLISAKLNGEDATSKSSANKTDLLPSCVISNPFIKVY